MLNNRQVHWAAEYLACCNTGLVGASEDRQKPTSTLDIDQLFAVLDYDFRTESGEGLDGELAMWKKKVQELKSDDYLYKKIQQEIPFILEA